MLSWRLLLQIWIGILRPCGMLYEWGCLKRWRTHLRIARCPSSFLRLWQFVNSDIIRSDNDARRKRHRTRGEWQVLPLPPDLRLPLKIPQELPLEQWLDILDLHQWISVQAGGGFPQKKEQKGLLIEYACIVVGLIIGLRSVRQGSRPRCS